MSVYSVKRKVIKSGKYIEIYDYGRAYWVGFPQLRSLKPKKDKTKQNKDQDRIRADNVRRSRNNIKRLVNANQQLKTFLTLTFKEKIKDLKTANTIFNRFVKRMMYKYPHFEYLAVPEFQKSGRVHYHLVCKYDLPEFGSNSEHREYEVWFAKRLWKNGFVNIKPIKEGNIGAYISKYLGKEMFDKRFFRKKKFFYSKTLKKPEEIRRPKKVDKFMKFFDPKAMKPVFETDFYSHHTGKTKYALYEIEDNNNLEKMLCKS